MAGLTSRCTTADPLASPTASWTYDSAWHASSPMNATISGSGGAALSGTRASTAARSTPSTYSMTRKSSSATRPKSKTGTMFLWAKDIDRRASRTNMSMNRGSVARSRRTRLMTRRFSTPPGPRRRARKSSAMPPRARGRTSSYRPSIWPTGGL